MSSSSCPFCHLIIPSQELERHANNHFKDEELARDIELAQQIALAPPSPPLVADIQLNDDNASEFLYGETSKSSTSRNSGGKRHIEEKSSCLVSLQIRSNFYKVEGGLMTLLRKSLELESQNSTSILSGYVDHFQSIESEDVGWGCGWRNVQMLSSHLLMQRQEAREVLFGGSGFVPDIPSLQRWLEIAWDKGYDVLGSDQFSHEIYGSAKWIGTTECATLFRSFGLRARIVDFSSKGIESTSLSVHDANPGARAMQINDGQKRKATQVYGPMDKFLLGRRQGVSQAGLVGHDIPDDSAASICKNNDNSAHYEKNNRCLARKIKGHEVLVDWVWKYFVDHRFSRSSNPQRVIVSDRTPLYFQHDGHSRTIVGIQAQQQRHGRPKRYTLLILDPSHRTAALERSLEENSGWQKLIKRGMHTLKKPQYQVCYIDPGIAHGEEMEHLKTLDSIVLEF